MKRLLPAILLAASTLAYSQQQVPDTPPAPPDTDQQQPAPQTGGGWPQAGQDPAPPPNQQQQPYGQPNGQYGARTGQYGQQQPQYGQQPPYGQPPSYGQGQQPNGPQQAPPPVPAQLTVPQGTYLTVRVNQRLSSDKSQVGELFTATLEAPIVVDGVVVAEPGQLVGGQVMEARKEDGVSHLAIRLTDLPLVDGQKLPIQTQLIAHRGNKIEGRDAGPILGTTALGAAIGGAVGWGTGAAIGAGAGALVSLGAVLTHGHASVIYPEQPITFRLEQSVLVSTTNAPQAFRYVQPGEYDQRPNGPTGNYASAAPPPPPPYVYGGYGYGYPYAYGYGYPYYGPSIGLYFGGPYYRGFYGHPYYGGRFYGGRGYGYRR